MLAGRFQKFFKGRTSGEAALFAHNEEREAFRVWVLNNSPHILSILAATEFHILLPISVDFHKCKMFFSLTAGNYSESAARRQCKRRQFLCPIGCPRIRISVPEQSEIEAARCDLLYAPFINSQTPAMLCQISNICRTDPVCFAFDTMPFRYFFQSVMIADLFG